MQNMAALWSSLYVIMTKYPVNHYSHVQKKKLRQKLNNLFEVIQLVNVKAMTKVFLGQH